MQSKERACENCRNSIERVCILNEEDLAPAEAALKRSPSETCRLSGLKYWQQKFFEYGSFYSDGHKSGCVTLRVPKGVVLNAASLLLSPADVETLRWVEKHWGIPKQVDAGDETLYVWTVPYLRVVDVPDGALTRKKEEVT